MQLCWAVTEHDETQVWLTVCFRHAQKLARAVVCLRGWPLKPQAACDCQESSCSQTLLTYTDQSTDRRVELCNSEMFTFSMFCNVTSCCVDRPLRMRSWSKALITHNQCFSIIGWKGNLRPIQSWTFYHQLPLKLSWNTVQELHIRCALMQQFHWMTHKESGHGLKDEYPNYRGGEHISVLCAVVSFQIWQPMLSCAKSCLSCMEAQSCEIDVN